MGDCWFLSAVAVLTEVSRISEVIITPEYNEEGIYTVRFCIQVPVSNILSRHCFVLLIVASCRFFYDLCTIRGLKFDCFPLAG